MNGLKLWKALMLEQLRFIRVPCPMLDEAARHAVEIVGLERVDQVPNGERFRSDARYYSLEFDASGQTTRPVVGISLRTVEQLDALSEQLPKLGWRAEAIPYELCRARRYHAGLSCRDLSGNCIELVVRPEDSGRRYFPSRDAGILGLNQVILGCLDPASDAEVWVEAFGARITDRVGDAVYLSWDGQHHRVMLVPSKRDSFLVGGYEVESIDAVMQSSYFLLERQVAIVRGPGKDPASGEIFLTFSSPVPGFYFSYSTGSVPLPQGSRPRQFADLPSSRCSWGSTSQLVELGGSAL
jgi:2,3-dihydroxy-p-cumate/2,3-dihydroxybenzoate 3,4-dioxygenase